MSCSSAPDRGPGISSISATAFCRKLRWRMSRRALRSFANSSHKSTEARNQESESMAPRVVVVGGGISGLAAAYDLTRAGVDCTVFERNTRPGGVIETRCWQDCRLDCGPDSFISAKPEALALIR